MGVYKEEPRDVAEKMGCKAIATKLVHTNKGDTSRPTCQSRHVGRVVRFYKRLDLISSSPQLETLKFLCSTCARGQAGTEPYRLSVIDIQRAYFFEETHLQKKAQRALGTWRPRVRGLVAFKLVWHM